MNKWLLRRLIHEGDDRTRIGTVGSATGVVVNVLLAVMKFVVGTLTGSVAVTADAANKNTKRRRSKLRRRRVVVLGKPD